MRALALPSRFVEVTCAAGLQQHCGRSGSAAHVGQLHAATVCRRVSGHRGLARVSSVCARARQCVVKHVRMDDDDDNNHDDNNDSSNDNMSKNIIVTIFLCCALVDSL